jgi:sorting nexin-1/2
LAASDPSLSLKKAFVKSSPAPRHEGSKAEGKKAYVFTPGKQGGSKTSGKEKETEKAKAVEKVEEKTVRSSSSSEATEKDDIAKTPVKEDVKEDAKPSDEPKENDTNVQPTQETKQDEPDEIKTATEPAPATQADTVKPIQPESIPLPASGQVTPAISRIASPVSANGSANRSLLSATNDLFSPKIDRVAVSPLDPPPPAEKDYGFHHLSIGGSSMSATAPPPQNDWTLPSTTPTVTATSTSTGSRFAGKGWAAVDDTDELFGPGGPSVRSDPWGNSGRDGEGWAGDDIPSTSGTSQVSLLAPYRDAVHSPQATLLLTDSVVQSCCFASRDKSSITIRSTTI